MVMTGRQRDCAHLAFLSSFSTRLRLSAVFSKRACSQHGMVEMSLGRC